jgi:hypothetical protein
MCANQSFRRISTLLMRKCVFGQFEEGHTPGSSAHKTLGK